METEVSLWHTPQVYPTTHHPTLTRRLRASCGVGSGVNLDTGCTAITLLLIFFIFIIVLTVCAASTPAPDTTSLGGHAGTVH